MLSPPGDPERENPDSVAAEIGVQGVEALPAKIDRYSRAKKGALDVAEYIRLQPGAQRMADLVSGCGDYLVFRHYITVDLVRLHGASLCKKHLLCPLCAIRRGAKALKAYLDRAECIKAENPLLRPFLVTLTVKDGPDLLERFQHLRNSQHELWHRKRRGRGSVLDGVVGAVWSYEVKRGKGSGVWHPHLHMIALAEAQPDSVELAREWKNITGDSHVVDVRRISQDDPVSGFIEVFKYAVKFSEQPPSDTWHCFQTLSGRRLIGSAGVFRGVDVPENLLDEELAGLPYIQFFYRYLPAGYSLARRSDGVEVVRKVPKVVVPAKSLSEKQILRNLVFDRLFKERLTVRGLPGGYSRSE